MYIAHGSDPENIYKIMEGQLVGTKFFKRFSLNKESGVS